MPIRPLTGARFVSTRCSTHGTRSPPAPKQRSAWNPVTDGGFVTTQQQELIAKYRAVPDILHGLVAGLSDDDGRIDGEGNDAWSIVEIVCHLRDAETRSIDRTRRMRDE